MHIGDPIVLLVKDPWTPQQWNRKSNSSEIATRATQISDECPQRTTQFPTSKSAQFSLSCANHISAQILWSANTLYWPWKASYNHGTKCTSNISHQKNNVMTALSLANYFTMVGIVRGVLESTPGSRILWNDHVLWVCFADWGSKLSGKTSAQREVTATRQGGFAPPWFLFYQNPWYSNQHKGDGKERQ